MIKTSTTLAALATKMANRNLHRTDTDLFYQSLVDHVRAVEDILQDQGVKFPDGTFQKSGLENRAPNINSIKRGVRTGVPVDDIVATFLDL